MTRQKGRVCQGGAATGRHGFRMRRHHAFVAEVRTGKSRDAIIPVVHETEELTRPQHRAPRGKYAPSRVRRELICSTVLDLVDQSGYDDVTVVRISEATGIPQSSVLYHFPTKDHLLVGAMELADAREREQYDLETAWPEFNASALTDLIDARLRRRNRLRLLTYLRGLAMQPQNPANAYLMRKDRETVEHWTRLCSRLQRQGEMHPALDPRQTALQILALWHGLVQWYLLDDSSQVKPDTLRDVFLNGVRHLMCKNWQDFVKQFTDMELGI